MKDIKASLRLKDKDISFFKKKDGSLFLKTKTEEIQLDLTDAKVISTFFKEFCVPKSNIKIGKELTSLCKEVILLEDDKFKHSD